MTKLEHETLVTEKPTYADHNTKPTEDVLHYVNKVWLPYANRTLKQIAA